MIPEIEELYQEVILDHSRRPRNFGELPDAAVRVTAIIRRAAMKFVSQSNSTPAEVWKTSSSPAADARSARHQRH